MDVNSKGFWLVVLVVLSLGVFSSCDEEAGDSYPPTWKGFTYYTVKDGNYSSERPQVYDGDRISVVARQKEIGNNLYGSRFSWSLIVDTFDVNTPSVVRSDTIWPKMTLPVNTAYSSTAEASGRADNGFRDPEAGFELPANVYHVGAQPALVTVYFSSSYGCMAKGTAIKNASEHENPYLGSIRNTYGEVVCGSSGSFFFFVQKK